MRPSQLRPTVSNAIHERQESHKALTRELMLHYLHTAQHSLLGAVATAQAIVLAVSKPVAAKVADVFGRAEAFVLVIIFYVVGFAVVAGSNGIHTYAAGALIYIVGYASLQIMLQIVSLARSLRFDSTLIYFAATDHWRRDHHPMEVARVELRLHSLFHQFRCRIQHCSRHHRGWRMALG